MAAVMVGEETDMYCQFCGTNLGKKKDCEGCEKKAASQFKPRSISDFSAVEKCVIFNKLYASALKHFEERKSGEKHEDNDDAHYMYEEQMTLMLGDGVFKAMNNF